MNVIEKLTKLKENIESTTVVTLSARQSWAAIIESVLGELEDPDEQDDYDYDDDDDEEDADEGWDHETLDELSSATGWPRWKVEADVEHAVREAMRRRR